MRQKNKLQAAWMRSAGAGALSEKQHIKPDGKDQSDAILAKHTGERIDAMKLDDLAEIVEALAILAGLANADGTVK